MEREDFSLFPLSIYQNENKFDLRNKTLEIESSINNRFWWSSKDNFYFEFDPNFKMSDLIRRFILNADLFLLNLV